MNADPVQLAAQLSDRVDGQIETDRPLAPFTSYKIGGSTAVWIAPATKVGVGRALEIIHEKKTPEKTTLEPQELSHDEKKPLLLFTNTITNYDCFFFDLVLEVACAVM